MFTLNFSVPMVAELDESHPLVEFATKTYDQETIAKLIGKSVVDTPEFSAFMTEMNKGGSWCVVNVDPEYIGV